MTATRGHRMSAIAAALGGALHGADDGPPIEHLSVDSRKPFPSEGTLFIALRGERHDGHHHIAELLARGLSDFLVEELPAEVPEGARFLVVRDTLEALQRLAAWHRSRFRIPVVGITGSNGKTVVKEWLFQLLRGKEHIVRSPGSWNSRTGVPLSVWAMGAEHTLGIFEAGISEPGEMERLRPIIKPTIGILTNIGPAHGENFRSDLDKAMEKLKLFQDAETLVYCADHATVREAIQRSGTDQRLKLLGWSRERSGQLHVVYEHRTAEGTRVTVINDAASFDFTIPFTDQASVENALHCVTLLLHLGHSPEWIAERTPHLAPVAMRLESVEGVHGTTLINDAYSNDVASLAIALDHLGTVGHGRRKAVVLSDILESGDAPDILYDRVAALLRNADVETLIAIGPRLAEHYHRFTGTTRFHPGTESLLADFDPAMLEGAAVLVKGARTFALERVVERWQRKMHGTVLEIDLEAVRHNLNRYRSLLAPGTRVMAMVKAFGYGGGAVELARLFTHERVDHLGVAYADEGIELRQQGIRLPVLVMNPEPVPFETLHRFHLEAEVYDRRSFQEAAAFARQHPDMPPVHLKLDTGMRRLGFTEEELPSLLGLLRNSPHLRIASVFSHLAASEDPAHDGFTREQLAAFTRMADAITTVLGYRPLRHIANSAAIVRFPEAHLDMVRPGIGLHGVGHDAAESALLRPAASLRSPIARITLVRAGESVGYGRAWRAEGERRIATLPIGYADGLSRRLGNGAGRVWVQGCAAPFAGNICMDLCMVDVTGIDCREGDMAHVFNAEHPVTELARDMGTIPYEVLTGISQRVKRVYVQG